MIAFQHVFYRINQKTILQDINFVIHDDEKVLIEGASGSGKSTLLNLIMGNLSCSEGAIFIDKRNLSTMTKKELLHYRKEKVTMILQQDDLYPHKTVWENLIMFYDYDLVTQYLKQTKMFHLKDKKISTLSGGERQRIAILKSCLKPCDILLCDEITSALDWKNAEEILSFIMNLFYDKTIIFISHTPDLFVHKINRKIKIENMKIIKDEQFGEVSVKENGLQKRKKAKRIFIFFKWKQNGSFSQFVLFLISCLCFSLIFSFDSLMENYAQHSYQQYYDYNVFEVKNNYLYHEDEISFYNSLDQQLKESKILIGENQLDFALMKPHFFKKQPTFILNDLLYHQFPQTISLNVEIIWEKKRIEAKAEKIVENQMFSTPTLYYSYFELRKFYNQCDDSKLYYINEVICLSDTRFSINPLYDEKQSNLPYLESNAMKDYLTYQLLRDSLSYIVQGYFLLIFFYCILTSVLLMISKMNKDIKEFAILIQRGFSSFQILARYFIVLLINLILTIPLLFLSLSFLFGMLFSFFIQCIVILISYAWLKKKSLHDLLKEDFLC